MFSYSLTSRAATYARESAGAGDDGDEEEEWQTYVHKSRTSFGCMHSSIRLRHIPVPQRRVRPPPYIPLASISRLIPFLHVAYRSARQHKDVSYSLSLRGHTCKVVCHVCYFFFAAPFSDRSCTSVSASFELTTAIKWFLKFIVHYWVGCANDGEYILILCLSCLMTIILQAGVDAYMFASTCIYAYQLLVLDETVWIFQMSELQTT